MARCTAERLMRRRGLREVIRGKSLRTTISNPISPGFVCTEEHVRAFIAGQPPYNPSVPHESTPFFHFVYPILRPVPYNPPDILRTVTLNYRTRPLSSLATRQCAA